MITNDNEKVYLLKNWMKEKSNIRFSESENKFIIVLFNHNCKTNNKENWKLFKNEFYTKFNLIINNLNKVKTEIINKLED